MSMKHPIDGISAARTAASPAQRRTSPAAKGRKASSTPSFRALAIRAVIAAFILLAVVYGLNMLMPMAFNLIGSRS